MRSLFMLFLFAVVVVGVSFFVRGQANSVKLDHICGKQVPWYDAAFLDTVKDKPSCEKYQ